MVRRNELACRDQWARDLWESERGAGGGLAVESRGEQARPLPPASAPEIAAVVQAGEAAEPAGPLGPHRFSPSAAAEDVVLSEGRFAGERVPDRPWRWEADPTSERDTESPARDLDTRSAIKKAREAYRDRNRQVQVRPEATSGGAVAGGGQLPVPAAGRFASSDDEAARASVATEEGASPSPTPRRHVGRQSPTRGTDPFVDGVRWMRTTDPDEPETDVATAAVDDDKTTREPGTGVEAVSPDPAGWNDPMRPRFGSDEADERRLEREPELVDAAPRVVPRSRRVREARENSFASDDGAITEGEGEKNSVARWRASVDPHVASPRHEPPLIMAPDRDAVGDVVTVHEDAEWQVDLEGDDGSDRGWEADAAEDDERWGVAEQPAVPPSPIDGVRQLAVAAEAPAWTTALPRMCRTCRDFRPAEGGGRGWCANQWAFTHRRMVAGEEITPCETSIGDWWLPGDEVWTGGVDVSAHGQPTPLLDAFLPHHREEPLRARRRM